MATTLALELNDAGLQLARATASSAAELIGAESPGVAVLLDGRVTLGIAAVRRQRAAPLHTQNRFWHGLGLDPLPSPLRGIATHADLAHAHLTELLTTMQPAPDAVLVIALPPGYSREQLGLLVGIANETGVPLRGLVDLGLAACAANTAAPNVLHLDLQLHQAALTVLELAPAEGVMRRVRYELLRGAGVLAFQQALAATIAAEFVRQTRFDPMHEATTEQRLHDLLPEWIARLADSPDVTAEMSFGASTHRITLTAALLSSAIEPLSNDVQRLVQAARPAGLAVRLCVSHRIAALPGLVERLAALRDCQVVELARGAAALGALTARESILRPGDAIALVHRLPVITTGPSGESPASSLQSVPVEAVPTHVLFRGRAWPVTAAPLTLGWSVAKATRPLSLPAGIAGLSKSHCTVVQHDGQAVVEDHSTYGTYVNDERVAGRVALRVGDVLRLGAPGVSLELIRVLPEHGAT